MLPSLLETIKNNKHHEYPQKIFELGKVFENDEKYEQSETQIAETEKLCISLCSDTANFTEIKQILDYLMRMLDIKYEIKQNFKKT